MSATFPVVERRPEDPFRFAVSGMIAMDAVSTANRPLPSARDVGVTTVNAARDEEIVAQDEAATYCFVVMNGCVRTTQLMPDGRRQVGEFLFAGDMFGWDTLDRHDFNAEAVTPVTLHRYARRDIDALVDRYPAISRRLRDLSARRLRAGRNHMVLLGRKTASERIASFLLEMADRISPDGSAEIELPMSRSDIGDYLGLTTETVSRRLTRFQADGTISIQGATIAIHDRQALGAAVGEPAVH